MPRGIAATCRNNKQNTQAKNILGCSKRCEAFAMSSDVFVELNLGCYFARRKHTHNRLKIWVAQANNFPIGIWVLQPK